MSQSTVESRRRPTRAELLAELGDDPLALNAFFRFCFVPQGRLAYLQDIAVPEDWGPGGAVLSRYLAVHVRLAIEQERYAWNGDQMVMSAGRLTTPNGAPLYVGLVPGSGQGDAPWVMNWIGERPALAELPAPPDLGTWPALDPAAEIAVAVDLPSDGRGAPLPGLAGASTVAQTAALAGAVHFALHRGLCARQLHGGSHGWFAPLWLRERDDLTAAPDLAVPIVAQGPRLVVRALLDPHGAYAPARAVVERWEQLPTWLVESWQAHLERETPPSASERPGAAPERRARVERPERTGAAAEPAE